MSMETQSSEGQTSGGQSSGGGRKKRQVKSIPFKLHGVKKFLDANVGLGIFNLEMPYDPRTSKFKKETYPPVLLDIKDDDQIESFKVMRRLSHPNILSIPLINQVKGEGVRVYVEPYSGVLSDLLLNKKIPLVNPKTNLIPSEPLQGIVSDIVDGYKYLRENDEYHGNFAWDTTYYLNDTRKIVTKLANLERKGSQSPRQCQVADCVALGYGLAEISEYAKQLHGVPAAACCLIDELSSCLISVTTKSLDTVMDNIKDRVFFWNEKRRRTFFAVEVPKVWSSAAVKARFTKSEAMPAMPWTQELYNGYLSAMEAYRIKNGIEAYKERDLEGFLRCISGMYTHHRELDVKPATHSVDYTVQSAHPRLCLDLKAAMNPAQPQPDQP